jgi:AcrR family transcriptional regulator
LVKSTPTRHSPDESVSTTESAPPARDAAASRRRILDAATEEFSAYGLAGARVARIAEKANINTRMIYAYFGSKDGLFDAVLEHHVLAAQKSVTLDPTDVPSYAEQVFDAYRSQPHLVRLYLWQYLERPGMPLAVPSAARFIHANDQAIARAQADGLVNDELSADRLLDHVLALTIGNLTCRPHQWTDDERRDVGLSVRRLTRPRSVPGPAA